MANIFGRTEMTFGGGFKADKGVIEDGNGISGILMQSLQVTYQRPVTKLFELGVLGAPVNVYYVEGRPQGSLTVARIIGFAAEMKNFFTKFGDVCKITATNQNSITLKFASDTCPSPKDGKLPEVLGLTMSFCLLTQIGFSIQAQQLVINENSTMEFADLNYA